MIESILQEFRAAEESISWAEEAFGELQSLMSAFFKGDFAAIVEELDPNTGENVQKIKFSGQIPKSFRRKATEALTNARHSFDQAIYATRVIMPGRAPKSVYYPWAQSPTDVDRLLASRPIDPRLWDTIRGHQPYGTSDTHVGGDDLIRTLATIANNKHTVGLSVQGHIATTRFPNIAVEHALTFSMYAPRWDSRKNEAELMRWIGDMKTDGEYEFSFVICLKDAKLAQPVEIGFALDAFTTKAKQVCESLKAKCIELAG